MKFVNKYSFFLFGFLLLPLILLVILLFFAPFQLLVLRQITNWFSEKTDAPLTICHFSFSPLGHLEFSQLLLRDCSGDTLVYIDNGYLKFSPIHLYTDGTFTLDYLSLRKFYVNLYKDSSELTYNFQPFIEAFASNSTEEDKTSNFDLAIKTLLLSDGRFSHQIRSSAHDAVNYQISGIEAWIEINSIDSRNLNITLEQLAARDNSGLEIDSLSFRFFSSLDTLFMENFSLILPRSNLFIPFAQYEISKGEYRGEISSAQISLPEFSRYAEEFSDYPVPLSFCAQLQGEIPAMQIDSFACLYGSHFRLESQELFSSDLSNWEKASYRIRGAKLFLYSDFVKLFSISDMPMPANMSLFPMSVLFDGEGVLPAFSCKLKATSPVGNCGITGDVSSHFYRRQSEFALQLSFDSLSWKEWVGLGEKGRAEGDFDLSGRWDWYELPDWNLWGEIRKLSLNNHQYAPVGVRFSMKGETELRGSLSISDVGLSSQISLEMVDWSHDSLQLSVVANFAKVSPTALNWSNSLGDRWGSGVVKLSGVGRDWRRWKGSIFMDSLCLFHSTQSLELGTVNISKTPDEKGGQRLCVSSSLINGQLNGFYDFSTIYPQIQSFIFRSLPALASKNSIPTPTDNRFDLQVEIHSLDSLFHFFHYDCSLLDTIQLFAKVSSDSCKVNLSIPSFRWKEYLFEAPCLSYQQIGDSLSLLGEFFQRNANLLSSYVKSKIQLDARENRVNSQLFLSSFPDSSRLYLPLRGSLLFQRRTHDEVALSAQLDSALFRLNREDVKFSKTHIGWHSNRVEVSNLSLRSKQNNQLFVEGVLSPLLSDTLRISFRDLELKSLLSLISLQDFSVDAKLNGELSSVAFLDDGMRIFTDNFQVDSLRYNTLLLGDLTTKALWNHQNGGVATQLTLKNNDRTIMGVEGLVFPSERKLSMELLLDSVPLKFLTPFLSNYISSIEGTVRSRLRIKGIFPELSLHGDLSFTKSKIGIGYTGTSYTFGDTLRFDGGELKLDRFRIFDEMGHILYLDGTIRHESFREFYYRLGLNMNDFLLFNNPKSRTHLLSGHFLADAKDIRLEGDKRGAVVTGEFRNSENSSLYIQLPRLPNDAVTYHSIIYVESEKESALQPITSAIKNSFNWKVDMMIDLTDKSTFYLSLFNGAMIRGNGKIRLLYDEDKIFLYNRFQAEEGYLKMKLSGLPEKNFQLKKGSYVDFNGDPLKFNFDATVFYRLTADLATLSPSFSSLGMSSTRVPVQCELNASGALDRMNLYYDVNLPESSDEITENFNSIVNSDAIKLKEFAYLLGVGIFYDPSGRVKGDAFSSMASSSLSSALNNSLANLIGNRVELGAGFSSSKENFSDLEMNFSLSTKFFKERLFLKSSFGYQPQSSENGESSFLGNFDAELLLTRSGLFRLKFYNHTNNELFRTANNTQGIGFLFVREARRWSELFRFSSATRKTTVVSDTLSKPNK